MQQRFWVFAIVALVVAACGAGPPDVTPTVAPTFTPDATRIAEQATNTPIIRLTDTATPSPLPTNTPVPTETATNTPTATLTVTASITPTGTQTPSSTPTETLTPTLTPTLTSTPTLTPSNTPTETPSPTETDVPSPTALVFADTDTPTPSPSATLTSTATQTLTPVPSSTATSTATLIPLPSATNTAIPTATQIPDTATPTATNTALPTETATNTLTPTVTATNTPDLEATRNAEILQTRAALPQRATFTPVAIASPTNTLVPPTLDVSPTFVTATAIGVIPTLDITVTPIESTPIIDFTAPTATSTPVVQITPSPFPIDQIPATVEFIDRSQGTTFTAPAFNNTTTSALTFTVGEGQFIFNGEALGGSSVRLFAVNPADPNSFARTNAAGVLTFAPIGGSEGAISSSPFVPGFSPASAEENQDFINAITWSPNGQRLAFIIQPAGGTDNTDAGVWFWDAASGQAFVLLHDCPFEGFNSCDLTSKPLNNWRSISAEWSPNSQRILITANLTTEGRQGIFVADMNFASSRPEAPSFLRWDNGQWLNNGQLLVSGRSPDGRSLVAIYDLALGDVSEVLYDASANGLFIFDAVQRPNGQIFAVGREGGAGDGAYRVYRIANGTATPISGFVGNSPPQRVSWSANYGEVVFEVDGQQVLVNVTSGAITGANTSGSVQVGNLTTNPDGEVEVQAPPPAGVVANTRYNAGQQIQFVGDIPRNMRLQPNTGAGFVDIVNPGEFVTVLAGPYEADGYEWWQVSNTRNSRAWISTHVLGGGAFFVP